MKLSSSLKNQIRLVSNQVKNQTLKNTTNKVAPQSNLLSGSKLVDKVELTVVDSSSFKTFVDNMDDNEKDKLKSNISNSLRKFFNFVSKNVTLPKTTDETPTTPKTPTNTNSNAPDAVTDPKTGKNYTLSDEDKEFYTKYGQTAFLERKRAQDDSNTAVGSLSSKSDVTKTTDDKYSNVPDAITDPKTGKNYTLSNEDKEFYTKYGQTAFLERKRAQDDSNTAVGSLSSKSDVTKTTGNNNKYSNVPDAITDPKTGKNYTLSDEDKEFYAKYGKTSFLERKRAQGNSNASVGKLNDFSALQNSLLKPSSTKTKKAL